MRAYAIWPGLGIILVALAGYVLYRQKLDAPALLGMAMILGGCLVINLFSKNSSH
jgi:small multidrug resistance pump